jgi:hypothetical protein
MTELIFEPKRTGIRPRKTDYEYTSVGTDFYIMMYNLRLARQHLATVLEFLFHVDDKVKIRFFQTSYINQPLDASLFEYVNRRLYSGPKVVVNILPITSDGLYDEYPHHQVTYFGTLTPRTRRLITRSKYPLNYHILNAIIDHDERTVHVVDNQNGSIPIQVTRLCLESFLPGYMYDRVGQDFTEIVEFCTRIENDRHHGVCMPSNGLTTYYYLKGLLIEGEQYVIYDDVDLYRVLCDDFVSVVEEVFTNVNKDTLKIYSSETDQYIALVRYYWSEIGVPFTPGIPDPRLVKRFE